MLDDSCPKGLEKSRVEICDANLLKNINRMQKNNKWSSHLGLAIKIKVKLKLRSRPRLKLIGLGGGGLALGL